MWGDSIAVHLHWDGSSAATSCSGEVKLDVKMGSSTISRTADFATDTVAKVLLTGVSGLLQESTSPPGDISILSSSPGAQVLPRPDFGDYMVEIPHQIPTCGYSPCGNILATVEVTAKNSNPSKVRTGNIMISLH